MVYQNLNIVYLYTISKTRPKMDPVPSWSALLSSPSWLSKLRALSAERTVALARSIAAPIASPFLRGLTASQLYHIVRSVHVPRETRTEFCVVCVRAAARVRASVVRQAGRANAVVLAMHHLAKLGTATKELFSMDLVSPPVPGALPTFIAVASVAEDPGRFIEKLLSHSDGRDRCSDRSSNGIIGDAAARRLRLALCVAWCVVCGERWVIDLIGDVLASSPNRATWGRMLSFAISEKVPDEVIELCQESREKSRDCINQEAAHHCSLHLRMLWAVQMSNFLRRVNGVSVVAMTGNSVLRDVAELDFSGVDISQAAAMSKSLIERLGKAFRSLPPSAAAASSARTILSESPLSSPLMQRGAYLIAAFFSTVNKTYQHFFALSSSQVRKEETVYLQPMKGWTCANSARHTDGSSNSSHIGIRGRRHLAVICGCFWIDLIREGFSNDTMRMVTNDSPGTPLWELYYRTACLCAEEMDGWAVLWKLADEIDCEDEAAANREQIVACQGSASTHSSAAKNIVGLFKSSELNKSVNTRPLRAQMHDVKFQKNMGKFCKTIVLSLKSVTRLLGGCVERTNNQGAATSSTSTGDSIRAPLARQDSRLRSINLLTKLIGCLGSLEICQVGSKEMPLPPCFALVHSGAIGALSQVLLCQSKIPHTHLMNTLVAVDRVLQAGLDVSESHPRKWMSMMKDRLLVELSNPVLGYAISGVMNRSSKIAAEVVEILALDLIEIWRVVNRTQGTAHGGMSHLAVNLAQSGFVQSFHTLIMQQQYNCNGVPSTKGLLYAAMQDTKDIAGVELAGYVVEFILWVLEDAANSPLAIEIQLQNQNQKEGFAQSLWNILGLHGKSQDMLLNQLQQMSFGTRAVRGTSEGPCYELRRELLMACPLLQGGYGGHDSARFLEC